MSFRLGKIQKREDQPRNYTEQDKNKKRLAKEIIRKRNEAFPCLFSVLFRVIPWLNLILLLLLRWVFTSPCVGSSSTWNDLHGGWATIQGHRFFPGQVGSFS
jgi:hypothetical protein